MPHPTPRTEAQVAARRKAVRRTVLAPLTGRVAHARAFVDGIALAQGK